MARNKNKIRQGWDDTLFDVINYSCLIVIFLMFTYPLWFIVIASISDPTAVYLGEVVLWPKGFSTLGYKRVLENPEVWIGYANTILYTVGGTILNVVLTAMAGYALSRRDLIGRSRLALILIITMYFSGGMIPNYLNMRDFGLTNTRLSMMVVGLVGVSNVLVTRNFFRGSVPWSLHEAAFLDGASDFQVFTQVILPLSKPILALITINYAVFHWNDFMNARIYLRDKSMYPLQMVLREILLETNIESLGTSTDDAETILSQILEQKAADQIKYALIVVATVPMLAVYPFLEKYFSKARGQMVGGVKG